MPGPGTRIKDPGSWILDVWTVHPVSGMLDLKPWTLDPRSRVLDPEAGIRIVDLLAICTTPTREERVVFTVMHDMLVDLQLWDTETGACLSDFGNNKVIAC